jgi:hypothetical protein
MIEHPTLQKLDLDMWPKDLNELQWPMNCTLTYLRLRTSITLNQFYLILHSSPCLKTIIVKDFNIDQIYLYDGQFSQLTSLTCENGRIKMDKLEQCLALTPALVYLKLIGNGNLFDSSFDGDRWEKLIQKHLPLLEKFEFYMSVLTHVNFDTNNIEQMISFFETTFWIDEKHCFVQCDYIIYSHQLMNGWKKVERKNVERINVEELYRQKGKISKEKISKRKYRKGKMSKIEMYE